jgi:hypothetical protein
MHVAGVGNVSLITMIDTVSRWHRSRAIRVWRQPIRLALPTNSCSRAAFLTVGLPRRITLDHGTVFYDNTSPSPFATRLHLWLLADSALMSASPASVVPPIMPRPGRTHQTMTLQALLGQQWPDQTALWAGLDARRSMLNQHIPSSVLQDRAPLQAYPQAAHSGRISRPEWEAELLDLDRVAGLLVALSLVPAHPSQRAAGSWWL